MAVGRFDTLYFVVPRHHIVGIHHRQFKAPQPQIPPPLLIYLEYHDTVNQSQLILNVVIVSCIYVTNQDKETCRARFVSRGNCTRDSCDQPMLSLPNYATACRRASDRSTMKKSDSKPYCRHSAQLLPLFLSLCLPSFQLHLIREKNDEHRGSSYEQLHGFQPLLGDCTTRAPT